MERPDGSRAMSRGSPCEGPGLRQQATAVHDSKGNPAFQAPSGALRGGARLGSRRWPARSPCPARPRPSRAAVARYGPLVVLALAGVGLIVSEFLTYREIVAVTVVPEGGITKGGAHHGYALGADRARVAADELRRGDRRLAAGVGRAGGARRPRAGDRGDLRRAVARRHGPDRAHLRPRRGQPGRRLLAGDRVRGGAAGRRAAAVAQPRGAAREESEARRERRRDAPRGRDRVPAAAASSPED